MFIRVLFPFHLQERRRGAFFFENLKHMNACDKIFRRYVWNYWIGCTFSSYRRNSGQQRGMTRWFLTRPCIWPKVLVMFSCCWSAVSMQLFQKKGIEHRKDRSFIYFESHICWVVSSRNKKKWSKKGWHVEEFPTTQYLRASWRKIREKTNWKRSVLEKKSTGGWIFLELCEIPVI